MIVDRPMDLPLDVMVELYYDYCWDDIMTTGETSIDLVARLPHSTAVWLDLARHKAACLASQTAAA